MNRTAFETQYTLLKDYLSKTGSSFLPENEIVYRLDRLTEAFEDLDRSTRNYYSFSHEILTLKYLHQLSNKTRMALDSAHQTGCDFEIEDHYVECVCISAGQLTDYFRLQDKSQGLINVNTSVEIINSRLTQVIKDKLETYHRHVLSGKYVEKPFILFISMGELAQALGTEYYGRHLLHVLYGVHQPTVIVDQETGNIVNSGFSFRKELPKPRFEDGVIVFDENAQINCTIFRNNEYEDLSGILLSDSPLCTEYGYHNTVLFINPIAKRHLNEDLFSDLCKWCYQERCGVESIMLSDPYHFSDASHI